VKLDEGRFEKSGFYCLQGSVINEELIKNIIIVRLKFNQSPETLSG
jgi:hypothetical protein